MILDLEDSIAPSAKPTARSAAAARLASHTGRPGIIIRINPRDTEWYLPDLVALVPRQPEAILLPKWPHAVAPALGTARIRHFGECGKQESEWHGAISQSWKIASIQPPRHSAAARAQATTAELNGPGRTCGSHMSLLAHRHTEAGR